MKMKNDLKIYSKGSNDLREAATIMTLIMRKRMPQVSESLSADRYINEAAKHNNPASRKDAGSGR